MGDDGLATDLAALPLRTWAELRHGVFVFLAPADGPAFHVAPDGLSALAALGAPVAFLDPSSNTLCWANDRFARLCGREGLVMDWKGSLPFSGVFLAIVRFLRSRRLSADVCAPLEVILPGMTGADLEDSKPEHARVHCQAVELELADDAVDRELLSVQFPTFHVPRGRKQDAPESRAGVQTGVGQVLDLIDAAAAYRTDIRGELRDLRRRVLEGRLDEPVGVRDILDESGLAAWNSSASLAVMLGLDFGRRQAMPGCHRGRPFRNLSLLTTTMAGATLAELTLLALDRGSALARLPVPRDTLARFLTDIEAGHDASIPYHNAEHVKTVVAACDRVWHDCGLREVVRAVVPAEADVEELALFVAAAVHDHQHRGVTNDYLIRTVHPYAVTHNDQSPNESHHVASAFQLMFDRHDFVRALPPAQARLFRARIIELVLATDIAHHFAVVQSMRSRDFADMAAADVPLLIKAALKTADLGHTFMPWREHCLWSKRLQQELFCEGDLHRSVLGAEPPTIMDRRLCAAGHTFESSQAGFFLYVVLPLLECLVAALPGVRPVLEQARANALQWETSLFPKTTSGTLEIGREGARLVPL
ncbi:hypothetical protein WJX74_004725 [Apatococcus lobatus]|uniref:PDEase domain-containing protein n=1 Tax=Apatococcus lobatus TaxID=904363 RepID=A0AAW1SG64_9CHLO